MRKLLFSSSLLVTMISFSPAHAERIVCRPVEIGLIRSVSIDSLGSTKYTMRIEYMDSSSATGAAEWGDDVDSTYFTSKTLNAQLEYRWVEMQQTGRAHGSFYRDSRGSSKRQIIAVFCKTNSKL